MPEREVTRRAQIVRALPQGLFVVALLAILVTTVGDGWWWAPALFLLLFTLAGMVREKWWAYVRTGERPRYEVAPELRRPGDRAVVIEAVGEREVSVIRAVRLVTGLGLLEAKELTRDGAVLADGVSAESAAAIVDELDRAGARARVEIRPDTGD